MASDGGIDRHALRQASGDTTHGDTVLHWAARENATHLAQKLLQAGLPVDMPNDLGQTPLHLAVELLQPEMCKLFITAGADQHSRDNDGESPLDLAMRLLLDDVTHEDTLSFLVRRPTEIDDDWFQAFCFALSRPESPLLDIYLRNGWAISERNPRTGRTALHYFALDDNGLVSIRYLVEAGTDVTATDSCNVTALHIAAQHCVQTDTVQYLLQSGAAVDAIDSKFGGTPLGAAIFGEKPENARLLIEAGADVFHKVESGRSLFHLTAQQGQHEIIRLLLAGGVQVNMLDETGETAAYWAAVNGHLDCIKLLLDKGLDPAMGTQGPMMAAVKGGHALVVEALLDHGLPMTEICLRHLHVSKSFDEGDIEMFRLVVRHLQTQKESHGAALADRVPVSQYLSLGFLSLAAAYVECDRARLDDLDENMRALLLFVCAQHSFKAGAVRLLNAGSPLDRVRKYYVKPLEWRALEIAVCKNDLDLLKIFLQNNWDPNHEDVRGRTSLHLAALCGAVEVLKELVVECAVHHRDKDGNTPVHLGAYAGSVTTLELLFHSGGDLNRPNKAGNTPLGVACEQGHVDAVRWLLNNVSQCEKANICGFTPLHHCARQDHVDCIDLLITSGANPNTKSTTGDTPMHIAAKHGTSSAISRLLQAGGDANCVNNQGITPLAAALSAGTHSPTVIDELITKTSLNWDTSLSQT